MTKKDFILIAEVIKNLWLPGKVITGENREAIAVQFAKALAATNPKFKQATFLEGCRKQKYKIDPAFLNMTKFMKG